MCLIPACQRSNSTERNYPNSKVTWFINHCNWCQIFTGTLKSKAWTGKYKTFKQRRFILTVCLEIQFIVIKYVVQNLQTKIKFQIPFKKLIYVLNLIKNEFLQCVFSELKLFLSCSLWEVALDALFIKPNCICRD